MRNTRTIRAAAVFLAAAVLLTGCMGIPREGGVRDGRPALTDDNPAPVFLPSKPRKDATPDAILRGFIDASSSPEGNYAIAREFLTPEFGSTWEPDAGVTVDDGTGRSTTVVDERTMQFSVTPVAEVNANGQYQDVTSSSPVPLRYQFAQVGGQWRISAAPNGTVIDRTTFRDVFSAQALYFFDPGFRFLVPDLRWFPRGASAPTKIVKGVLAGPSPWLAGAVVTAFPAGTKLTADAVRVAARDAKVDLNSEALNADRVTLQRMKTQLARSLPPGLTATITIDQNSQDIGEIGPNAPTVNPRVDARALILRDRQFGFLAANGSGLTPIAGMSESVVALKPTAVTLAPGQTMAAVLSGTGVFGVRVGADPLLVDSRAGLIAPSVDADGYIWSVPSTSPDELVVRTVSGDPISVPTQWQEATSIASLDVSRDGTRLLALLRFDSDYQFVVASIQRENSVPVGLGDPLVLSSGEGAPLDATWIDDLTAGSLVRLPGGDEQIIARQIGGVTTPLESSPGSVAIAGSNTLRELRALSAGGALQVQRGVGWQKRIDKVVLIADQQGIRG
ncbi:MAG: LpqB family beta-propeller domain-containing protein [Cryobacterium sp.]